MTKPTTDPITYVDTLPKSIKTATGTIVNPSLETCQQHGYELTTPEQRQQREQAELQRMAIEQQQQQAELERQIELKCTARQHRAEFCDLAGIDPSEFTAASVTSAIATTALKRK